MRVPKDKLDRAVASGEVQTYEENGTTWYAQTSLTKGRRHEAGTSSSFQRSGALAKGTFEEMYNALRPNPLRGGGNLAVNMFGWMC